MKLFWGGLAFLIALQTSGVGADDRKALEAPLPPDLVKTFERYTRAWADADWGRIFEINNPAAQKTALQEFGSRDAWIEHQEKSLKDRVLRVERQAVWRVGEASFTFAISTKVRRPDKREETLGGFATFEWIEGKWYLVEPILPGAAQTSPPSRAP
ncbi:MAG: hypothetical protein IT578_06620 [Verrucomicrobiae bacterium]|nr:hypothetical protein [Verrucomicrobiae bacterium]